MIDRLRAFAVEVSRSCELPLLTAISCLVAAHAADIGNERLSSCIQKIKGYPKDSPSFIIGRLGLAYFRMAIEQIFSELDLTENGGADAGEAGEDE